MTTISPKIGEAVIGIWDRTAFTRSFDQPDTEPHVRIGTITEVSEHNVLLKCSVTYGELLRDVSIEHEISDLEEYSFATSDYRLLKTKAFARYVAELSRKRI